MLPIGGRLGVVCAGVAVAVALTASIANAQEHTYAIIDAFDISSDANLGAGTEINTAILDSASCSNFVNHEFWYGTTGNAQYWVEVGVKNGITGSGGCVSDQIFWADNRNGGGYHEHYYPGITWSLNAWYATSVMSNGSCEWDIWFGGIDLGNSTSNCPGSGRALEAGIEHLTQVSETDYVQGFLYNWIEENSAGDWLTGWDSVGLFNSNPPEMIFLSSNETAEELNESF